MKKKKMVYAAGVFDLLHYGHIRYLERAKSLGDVLVVGLVDDEGVERYKFRRPLISFEKRWEVVKSIKYVDYIVRQNDTDPTETLEKLKDEHNWIFDIMCRSDDYKGVPPGTDFIVANGGKVIRIPYCWEISSTKIKERLLSE